MLSDGLKANEGLINAIGISGKPEASVQEAMEGNFRLLIDENQKINEQKGSAKPKKLDRGLKAQLNRYAKFMVAVDPEWNSYHEYSSELESRYSKAESEFKRSLRERLTKPSVTVIGSLSSVASEAALALAHSTASPETVAGRSQC